MGKKTIETIHTNYTKLPHCVLNRHLYFSGEIFSILHFTGYEQITTAFLPWLNINSTKGTLWTIIVLPFIPLRRFDNPISTCACLCIFLLNCSNFLTHWGHLFVNYLSIELASSSLAFGNGRYSSSSIGKNVQQRSWRHCAHLDHWLAIRNMTTCAFPETEYLCYGR